MKNKRFWILMGSIVVLCTAFLWLNFHVAVSNTHSEKNIITTGMGGQLPEAMRRFDKISVALIGESPMVSALQKALAAEMDHAGIGEFAIARVLKPAYPNPVLIVNVGRPSLIWTPFFATSQVSIQAGYASNGDTSFMGKTSLAVDNKNGPVLNMSGEYKVSDKSWGLISRVGYHQILMDYLAQQIVAALNDLYKMP